MEDILKELEFYPASCRVKKTRCYYIKDHMTAAADKVENLGNFLELEIIVAKEEERAGGLDMIYELMRMLGCEKTETVGIISVNVRKTRCLTSERAIRDR